MKILALFALFHVVFHLGRRAWHEGLFFLEPGDLIHTLLVLISAGLSGYTITLQDPASSVASWIGLGIYAFALLLPGILVEWALRTHDSTLGPVLLKIAASLAPTAHHRGILRIYLSTQEALSTRSETISAMLEEQVSVAKSEDFPYVMSNLLDFLTSTGQTLRAYQHLAEHRNDPRWDGVVQEEILSPVTKAFLMEGAAMAHDAETFEWLFSSITEDLVNGQEGAGKAYLMAGAMILALSGTEKGVKGVFRRLERFFPDGFVDVWTTVARVRHELAQSLDHSRSPDQSLFHEESPTAEKQLQDSGHSKDIENSDELTHSFVGTTKPAGESSIIESLISDLDEEGARKVRNIASFAPSTPFMITAVDYVLRTTPVHEVAYALREKISFPLVTAFMVGALVLSYVVEMALGGPNDFEAMYRLGANVRYIPLEPWRFFTAWLLHGGLAHLALNAYAMWVLGRIIEHHYGRAATWIIAITAAVAGNALSYYYNAGFGYSVGSSTAVFGLMGAGISMLLVDRSYFPSEWRRQTLTTLMFWLVINVIFGLSVKVIDNAGHLGGLLGGGIIGALLARSVIQRWRRPILSTLAFLFLLAQAWALLQVARNYMVTQYRDTTISGIHITVPAYWMRSSDEQRGEYIQIPACTMVPTLKVIPIETGTGAGNLYLAGLLEERLDLMKERLGYKPVSRHSTRVPPWFGLRTRGTYQGHQVFVDLYLRRYGDEALLFVEFFLTPSCVDRVRKQEERVLRSVRWPKWEIPSSEDTSLVLEPQWFDFTRFAISETSSGSLDSVSRTLSLP